MEKMSEGSSRAIPSGSRQMNLNKSFKRALRSLLTACPKEEFSKAFPNFTAAEQARLQRLFFQVVTSLHEEIEEAFESVCLETQAGTILDTVEELVEENNLDPLPSEKSNVTETMQNLTEAKKNELYYLTDLLKKAEDQKRNISARLELLKKDKHEVSRASNFASELRSEILNYETSLNTTTMTNK